MTQPRGASLGRRVRSFGGRVIRRAGLLPAGTPNGLGQDERLLGRTLPHTVMVFFPDPPDSLPCLERWYEPLAELDGRHRVVAVTMDSRSAHAIRHRSGLDTIVVAHYTTVDDLLLRSDVKVALYVADHPENFSNLRFNSMVHARLVARGPGCAVLDNRVRAYDFCLECEPGPRTDDLPFHQVDGRWLRVRAEAAGLPAEGAFPAAIGRLIEIRDREQARLHGLRGSRR